MPNNTSLQRCLSIAPDTRAKEWLRLTIRKKFGVCWHFWAHRELWLCLIYNLSAAAASLALAPDVAAQDLSGLSFRFDPSKEAPSLSGRRFEQFAGPASLSFDQFGLPPTSAAAISQAFLAADPQGIFADIHVAGRGSIHRTCRAYLPMASCQACKMHCGLMGQMW